MNGASIEDIQIAYNLAGDLNEYGDNLEKNLKTLERRHSEMANYFKGKQFNDLTNVINSVGDKIKRSIEDLRGFAAETKEEAIALAEVRGVKLN